MEGSGVGMVTCSKEDFLSGSSLSFQVAVKVVLVLDRRSVDTGQIIGVLCEDDVVCPGLLEQDWVMLAEGSWVRHPKVRGGRIRLRRDGWLAVRHESYGELLSVFPSGRVRALFESGGFAAVPAAKLPKPAAARAKAAAARAAAGAPAAPEGAAAAARAEDLPALGEESLKAHMKLCGAQHWQVVHDAAHLRSHFKRGARVLVTVGQGGVVCLGSPDDPAASSPDGRWARCTAGAKVWSSAEDPRPRLLLGGREDSAEGYLLKEHEEHDILKRIDPKPKAKPRAAPAEGPGNDPHFELRRRLAAEDHWAVLREGGGVHAERSEAAAAELWLRSGDLLFSAGEEEPALWQEPGRRWLQLPAGAQVYRDDQWHHSLQARGFVLIEAEGQSRLERGREPEAAAVIRLVAGFGEPWEVAQERVQAHEGPSASHAPLGALLRGDVVGVRRRAGAWLELAPDSDLRADAGGQGAVASASAARVLTELEVRRRGLLDEGARWAGGARSREVRQVLRGDPGRQAWALAEDASGPLLRRCAAADGAVQAARLLSEERRELYRQVLRLCHQRIYLENLKGLWDGDSAKLPALETLEAKLFDGSSRVVHVAKAGGFCGGAVIKELPLRARGAGGQAAEATACYIDMCAAQPGSHAGGDVWELLVSLNYACVACHPILLQSTVDFWQGRGMRRFDAASERDRDEFRRQVLEHTGGLACELADLQECLPSSKLPLFVFVSRQFVQPRTRLGELL